MPQHLSGAHFHFSLVIKQALKIAAKSEHVVLNVDITQLHHVLTDDRMIVVEVYYLHGCYCLVTVLCCYESPFSAIRS